MDMSVPLDEGFLRRQCPHCEREFKWFVDESEESSDEPPPDHYFCPYCGQSAGIEDWWTTSQLEQARGIIWNSISGEMGDAMKRLERGGRNDLFRFEVTTSGNEGLPAALIEPSDMVIVISPCHPEEPIKVAEDWEEPLHCLICGEAFAIS